MFTVTLFLSPKSFLKPSESEGGTESRAGLEINVAEFCRFYLQK